MFAYNYKEGKGDSYYINIYKYQQYRIKKISYKQQNWYTKKIQIKNLLSMRLLIVCTFTTNKASLSISYQSKYHIGRTVQYIL